MISGLGRSPGGEHDNPLQYSCLENPHGQRSLAGYSLWGHMSIKSVMQSNHLILCRPLLLLPPVFPSIRVFSSELALCIRWPKYWSFSCNISPSNEYSGFISFKIDWFDLLAVLGTFESLLQHRCSKATILRYSACFVVQLSHPHMITGKTTTWTIWTFFGKVSLRLILP